MKTKLAILSVSVAIILTAGNVYSESKCAYSLKKDTIEVKWTAFKTTAKVAVGGAFTSFQLSTNKNSAHSIFELLNDVKVQIDLRSVSTQNPERDKSLKEYFFTKIQGISGKIKAVDEKHGTAVLALNFNKVTKEIELKYIENASLYTAEGNINILDFNAKEALDSISEKCHDLHKGADGISKTWPDVSFKIEAKISKECN